jgi:hypothetical protein
MTTNPGEMTEKIVLRGVRIYTPHSISDPSTLQRVQYIQKQLWLADTVCNTEEKQNHRDMAAYLLLRNCSRPLTIDTAGTIHVHLSYYSHYRSRARTSVCRLRRPPLPPLSSSNATIGIYAAGCLGCINV